MRKVREVLRLKYELGLHERPIARAIGITRSTVGDYLARAKASGMTWEIAKGLSDAEVEKRLFQRVGQNEPAVRAPVDFNWVHMELRRAGVTRQLLWNEYVESVAKGSSGSRPYQYSQFCELYEEHRGKLQPSMRQVHRAGEKAFLDYSGKKPHLTDPITGEVTEVELYVAVLGASNYTYAEATLTQTLGDFVGSTVRALEYFGCAPEMLVPDQLRSAVSVPHRYEPEINATYAEMGGHYGSAVVPARPRKPKDKPKVEGGVLIAQRWILACLRNRRFFRLEELNAAIAELLEKLNTRPFQKLEGCRRLAFEKLDRPAMKPLPSKRYEVGAWKLGVGVNIDYHLEYDHRHYSVPSALIKARVDVRATATVVEVWHDGARIASHERSYGPKGTAVTTPEHRPRAHREWGEWPPERLVGWAKTKGPKTAEVVAAILERGGHPEAGRRACLGLMRMGKHYGDDRLEAACARALAINNPRYKSVESILRSGFDKVTPAAEVEGKAVVHENIRGGAYFDREEEKQASGADKIGARDLDEERVAIIHESGADTRGEASGNWHGEEVKMGRNTNAIEACYWGEERLGRVEEILVDPGCAGEGVESSAGAARRDAALPALGVLIAQMRAAQERPRVVGWNGRRWMAERGGKDFQSGHQDEVSCTSEEACLPPSGSDSDSDVEENESSQRECRSDSMDG